MPFTLIKGSYHVTGYAPDGDSIRFAPDDPTLLDGLTGPPAELNAKLHTQLRIEAIDALETHYRPPGAKGNLHQPRAFGTAARDELLRFLGIGNVQWNEGETQVESADDGVPGHILVRSTDKYGRPIAFVHAGEAAEQDGAAVVLKAARAKASYNYHALATGLAYPTFYTGLFSDLRAAFAAAARTAREKRLGLFAKDATNRAFHATKLSDITEDAVILPKLFRRLSTYLVQKHRLKGFKAALAESREPLLDLTDSHFTHFDTFIEEDDAKGTLRLTRLPEELVFDEMRTRPGEPFVAVMTGRR
ncbi:MAG TPA: hypothetical protein VE684_16170 [Crenalkalicoccus sp.]|jgi:endonuclease YncB( thermonuclease family)|nr:hypothetical protein [Crenalkalicoccus sp.]